MDSLFERPGWRAVGVIATAILAGGALAWAAVTATNVSSEAGPTPTPSATPVAFAQSAIPQEVIDGVTVSEYLQVRSDAAPSDEVGAASCRP
jgi:hypothetical protein